MFIKLTYEEARSVMHNDPARFRKLVEESLVRQVAAINHLSNKGLYFWDYGNAFLLEASRAGKVTYIFAHAHNNYLLLIVLITLF